MDPVGNSCIFSSVCSIPAGTGIFVFIFADGCYYDRGYGSVLFSLFFAVAPGLGQFIVTWTYPTHFEFCNDVPGFIVFLLPVSFPGNYDCIRIRISVGKLSFLKKVAANRILICVSCLCNQKKEQQMAYDLHGY